MLNTYGDRLALFAQEVAQHSTPGMTAKVVAAKARAAQQAADAAALAAVMGPPPVNLAGIIANPKPPPPPLANGAAVPQIQAPVFPAANAAQQAKALQPAPVAVAANPPLPPPPPGQNGQPALPPKAPAQQQLPLPKNAALVAYPVGEADDMNMDMNLPAVVPVPVAGKAFPPPPPPVQVDPVALVVAPASPSAAKAKAQGKAAPVKPAAPVVQGPLRNLPLPPPPTPVQAAAVGAIEAIVNPNVLHQQQKTWESVLADMLAAKNSGDPRGSVVGAVAAEGDSDEESVPLPDPAAVNAPENPNLVIFDVQDTRHQRQSVKLMKAQFVSKYCRLMRTLGLSTKRTNVTGKSLELLFKSFFMCGDFPRSKVQYYSWIKSYISRAFALPPDVDRTYSTWFGVLNRNKLPQTQETGLRLTHIVRMCHAIRFSTDTIIIRSKRRRVSTGEYELVTAGQVMRQIIACWFAFLRPDETSRTTRTIRELNGSRYVSYFLPYRKNRPHSHFQLDLCCMCHYSPYLLIPVCPVCCQDVSSWRVLGEYISSDQWAMAIRQLAHAAGIPIPIINGRWVVGPYSVRIGGAHSAWDGGLDEGTVMKIGDWAVDSTARHYMGSSKVVADSYAIRWPLRRPIVFSEETHQN